MVPEKLDALFTLITDTVVSCLSLSRRLNEC